LFRRSSALLCGLGAPPRRSISGVLAYRARVLARPSVARVVDEARPFRKFFPPGAPDRD
jgi:glutathione S-transferase